MPSAAGSLELCAREIASAFVPLRDLAPTTAPALFRDLGIPLPDDTLAQPTFQSALVATANAAGALPGFIDQLTTAFSGNATEVIASGAALIAALGTTVASLAAIESALPPGSDFAGKISSYLLIRWFEFAAPVFSNGLTLVGLIDRIHDPGVPGDRSHPPRVARALRLDRLGVLLTKPEQLLGDVYGWGRPDFDGTALLARLADFLVDIPYPSTLITTGPDAPTLVSPFFDLHPTPPGLTLTLHLPLAANLDVPFQLSPTWAFHLTSAVEVVGGMVVTVTPPASIATQAGIALDGRIAAQIVGAPVAPDDAIVLIGEAGGSRLEAAGAKAGLGLTFASNSVTSQTTVKPVVQFEINRGKLVIDTSHADGFIAVVTSGVHLEAGFDLSATWQPDTGLRFESGATIGIDFPLHLVLGPVDIERLSIGLGFGSSGDLALELTAGLGLKLGPIQASVDRIGVEADLTFSAPDRNLGPVGVGFAFKPPNGVGLAVDVGIIKGGGFLYFDPDHGEYAGALELEFADFLALKAIGLITTRMPDGSNGFSLLIVITAEFPGGLQLGYGFTLLGVGGIIGLNRTMRLDALAEGVRTGAIESVMFPHDVVANAPRILSDLKAFFPPQQGTFLIGPMAKIGWGTPTLISVAVGVIIEIPGNIAIVGVIKVALPTEDEAILLLQVNFIGAIEFDRKRIWFFASLYESRVLTLTIDGELGLLVAYGDEPNLVLTVGGFHPAYAPPPLPFPTPRRVAINILNTDNARIGVSGYFAVTSNTAQFGAAAELYFGFSAFSVQGHIGFDALFRFSPFSFIIQVSASVSLKAFGVGLFSISLQFSLEGPTPWRARGTGSISLLFFEISADFDITWGEERDTTLPSVPVLPLLAAEIAKPEGWRTKGISGGKPLVILRALPDAESKLVLHPLGTLFVVQRAVPLDIRIDKIGSQPVADVSRCTVEVAGSGLVKRSDAQEMFALGQFQNLDDAAKLSRPGFEREHAGVELGSDGTALASQRATRRSARYEEIVIDPITREASRFGSYNATLFNHFLRGASVSRSPLSRAEATLRQPFAETIKATGDSYAVASTRDNTAAGPTFTSQAQARDYLAGRLAEDPSLTDSLHVIPATEVAA